MHSTTSAHLWMTLTLMMVTSKTNRRVSLQSGETSKLEQQKHCECQQREVLNSAPEVE